MYICSINCPELKINIDYHDSDRVLKKETGYYLTPKLFAQVEAWMIKNNITVITSQEQLNTLIELGFIKKYATGI
jgi:hypothetical protein